MEGDQGLGQLARLLCALLALALGSCGGNPPLGFDYYDPPLRVISVFPDPEAGPLAVDQPITVRFNTYVDTAPLTWYNQATVASGGARGSVRADVDMVLRQITFTPRRDYEARLYYDLSLNTDLLRSVTGKPLEGATSFRFFVGEHRLEELIPLDPVPEEVEGPVRWGQVAPLLASCEQCHGDPEWKLRPIQYEALVGQASEQLPERLLVRPYDAHNSYLMHKLLQDWPDREGQAQPPLWSGQGALPYEELLLIERWIAGGALP